MLKGKLLLAYLAGIIDGEGSVMIKRHRVDSKRGFRFELAVSVTNTALWLLELLKLNFGGRIDRQKQKKPIHKPCWIWRIDGPSAESCLKALLPFLQLKKAQAELALEFHSQQKRGLYLTALDYALQTAQALQMRQLNTQTPQLNSTAKDQGNGIPSG